MPIIIGANGTVGDLRDEIVRLENLLADLRHVAKGYMPTERNIAAAPLIDQWDMTVRTSSCLVGNFHKHSTSKGRLSVTSDLWVLAPELGFARSSTRFYKLGRRASAMEPQS